MCRYINSRICVLKVNNFKKKISHHLHKNTWCITSVPVTTKNFSQPAPLLQFTIHHANVGAFQPYIDDKLINRFFYSPKLT